MASKKVSSVAGVPGKDPTLPKVPLQIHGRQYFLAFDFNALATAEAATGLNLLGSLDLQNLNVIQYRALLFATLLKENPTITLEEVGSLVTLATLPSITMALVQAWTGSQPEIVETPKSASTNPPGEQPELS